MDLVKIVTIPLKISEVECVKERRLKFLKTARDEMKCGFKYKDWRSQEFKLFDSHYETLARTGKRFSVDERKQGHQASERKVNWRKFGIFSAFSCYQCE